MLTDVIALVQSAPVAEASTQAATFIKYFAAALILSQGSLIYTFSARNTTGKTRTICALIFLMHAALAALVVWLA
jgi:hypothetical protein